MTFWNRQNYGEVKEKKKKKKKTIAMSLAGGKNG